jgi:hypothetical protein
MQNHTKVYTELGSWLLFALITFLLSFYFDEPLKGFRYTAATWPRAIILIIVIFAILNAIAELTSGKKQTPARPKDRTENTISNEGVPADKPLRIKNFRRLATFCVPPIYIFLMPKIGFYISTPLFLLGYMLALGEKRIPVLLIAAFSISFGIIFVFTSLLFVPLPVGYWPGFYEISSYLVSIIR